MTLAGGTSGRRGVWNQPGVTIVILLLVVGGGTAATIAIGEGRATMMPPLARQGPDDYPAQNALGNWPSFRGPYATGLAPGARLPTEWNVQTGHNVRWTAAVPGYSHSSPIVWGDRVFVLTTVSSDPDADGRRSGARNNAIDDLAEREWRILAFDRNDGRVIWQRTAHTGSPRVKRHEKGSHANSTPATDGRYVVALFNSEGLFCYHFDGRLAWSVDLGRVDPGYWGQLDNPWGHASSPVIFEDLVIVQVDRFESSFLAVYRLEDGAEIWRVERDELATWSTPTLHQHDGRWQLITQGGNHVRGHDPRTGRELWRFADHAEVKVPTPFVYGETIVATGGAPPGRPVYAIDVNVTSDVSGSPSAASPALRWTIPSGGPYTSTPIAIGSVLFVARDQGILSSYDLDSGELIYRQRLGTGFSASPVFGDGKLYLTSEDGEVFVVRPGRQFELLATNEMQESCFATPALSDDLIVIRTRGHLYGIGGEG